MRCPLPGHPLPGLGPTIFLSFKSYFARYILSHYGTDGSLSITAHTPCLLASLPKTLPTSYCTFSTANNPCPFYCLPLTFPKPNTSHPCHLLFLTLTLPTLNMPHPNIPHLLPFLPLTIHSTNIYGIPHPLYSLPLALFAHIFPSPNITHLLYSPALTRPP